MKVISIVGARPQFIKAALVSRKLRVKNNIEEKLIHTGQHYDVNMSDVFFKELNIPSPDYYLDVGSGTHGKQTGEMLEKIESVLLNEKPNLVLVYGDTNSTLAGALSAAKLHIPVAHVEAGLRSYNKSMPEEINRVLTDHISDLLFVPTKQAIDNLKKEGIINNIYFVGDVMYDIALESLKKIDDRAILTKFELKPKSFILVTIHRAENTDNIEKLENIISAINSLAENGIDIVFPIHPRTKKAVSNYNIFISKSIKTLEPVSYFTMLALEKNAKIIITDSGGVQKEGFFVGTPSLVVRDETEWVELVKIGFNKLVKAKKKDIVESVLHLLEKSGNISEKPNLYGNGNASDRIVELLLSIHTI